MQKVVKSKAGQVGFKKGKLYQTDAEGCFINENGRRFTPKQFKEIEHYFTPVRAIFK